MKKSIRIFFAILIPFLLICATLSDKNYFFKLDKSIFNIDENITGSVFIYSEEIHKNKLNKKGYFGVDDENYEKIPNSIYIKLISTKNLTDFVFVPNALIQKNDSAKLSFKIPEKIKKKGQTYLIKIERTWFLNGVDTNLVVTNQFKTK